MSGKELKARSTKFAPSQRESQRLSHLAERIGVACAYFIKTRRGDFLLNVTLNLSLGRSKLQISKNLETGLRTKNFEALPRTRAFLNELKTFRAEVNDAIHGGLLSDLATQCPLEVIEIKLSNQGGSLKSALRSLSEKTERESYATQLKMGINAALGYSVTVEVAQGETYTVGLPVRLKGEGLRPTRLELFHASHGELEADTQAILSWVNDYLPRVESDLNLVAERVSLRGWKTKTVQRHVNDLSLIGNTDCAFDHWVTLRSVFGDDSLDKRVAGSPSLAPTQTPKLVTSVDGTEGANKEDDPVIKRITERGEQNRSTLVQQQALDRLMAKLAERGKTAA